MLIFILVLCIDFNLDPEAETDGHSSRCLRFTRGLSLCVYQSVPEVLILSGAAVVPTGYEFISAQNGLGMRSQ